MRSDPRFLISRSRKFVRNQTNVTVKRFFSSKTQQVNPNFGRPNVDSPLNPWALTGFIDGEGSFIIGISKNNNKVGWQVKLEFWLSLHEGDKFILESIKNYFGVGNIIKHHSKKIIHYRIASIKDMAKIFDHLDKYPLLTQKRADYLLFKEGYNLVINKQHLTISGLHRIIGLKASMNLGLSDPLKTAFPNVTPEIRPLVVNQTIADPQWLAGFASAEGCFFIGIHKSSTIRVGVNVQLEFQLTQHIRDEFLIRSFIEYLNCGNAHQSKNVFRYRVSKFSEISEKIIPFFKKYPIWGIKSKDFTDFCAVVELMNNKKHLSHEGIEEIRKVKSRTNTGRDKTISDTT